MRRFAAIVFAALLALPLWAAHSIDSSKVRDAVTAERIISEARTHLGKPYVYGGNGPNSFDCTGLTCYVYRQFGISLSRTSKDQANDGSKVSTRRLNKLQKGDLIIFGSRENPKEVGHVGIFIECDPSGKDFSFIHASSSGVMVSHLHETYYSERFLGARRVLKDFDKMNRKEKALYEEEMARLQTFSSGTTVSSPSTSVAPVSSDGHQPARYHTVGRNDTLQSIARKRGTTVEEICRLNGISPDSTPARGTRLRVR